MEAGKGRKMGTSVLVSTMKIKGKNKNKNFRKGVCMCVQRGCSRLKKTEEI